MSLVKPFSALSINHDSSAEHGTHSLIDRLNRIRVKMQKHAHHQHHKPKTKPVTAVTAQIIEISDDDSENEVYMAPPLQARRKLTLSTQSSADSSSHVDLTSEDSEDSDDSEVSDSAVLRRDGLHLHKRPKTRHPLPTKAAQTIKQRLPQPIPKRYMAQPGRPEYPKLHLVFPNRNQGDDRATLSFRRSQKLGPAMPGSNIPSASARLVELEKTRSQSQVAKICPYYYDQRLELKMYRGAGYETFPVVLGSVQGHKEVCDIWDARQAERRLHQQAQLAAFDEGSAIPIIEEDENAPGVVSPAMPTEDEQQCLAEVLQIFPQIQHKFVIEKYRDKYFGLNTTNTEDVMEFPTSADVISEIAEMDTFPKEEPEKEKPRIVKAEDENGVTIDWNRNASKNNMYYKESIILLAREFDHIPTHYIYRIIHERHSLYDTYLHLKDAEDEYFNRPVRPYSRSRQPRIVLEKKYQFAPSDRREGHQYVSIINEFQAAKQKIAREALRLSKQKEKEAEEATNLQIHKTEGALIECQCCFDDEIPINRAVSCQGDDVHFFCFGCVGRLAETQVGAMKFEMCCMDGSGCKAVLSTEGVGQAVSIKIFDKLAFNQQQSEISAAGLEGLEQCPFCDFKAICDPIEVDSVFMCQNDECGRSTCRKCHEDSHLPKSCAEVKAEKGLSARHLVEEARSEAMIRQCPKCKVKIVKELGCNKMRCTTCACVMCYVCKADISSGKENGYQHFNKHGATCKLYDDQGIDRHVVEADEAERAAIKKVKETDEDVDEDGLRVDTKKGDEDEKLGGKAEMPRRVPVGGPAAGHLAYAQLMAGRPGFGAGPGRLAGLYQPLGPVPAVGAAAAAEAAANAANAEVMARHNEIMQHAQPHYLYVQQQQTMVQHAQRMAVQQQATARTGQTGVGDIHNLMAQFNRQQVHFHRPYAPGLDLGAGGGFGGFGDQPWLPFPPLPGAGLGVDGNNFMQPRDPLLARWLGDLDGRIE